MTLSQTIRCATAFAVLAILALPVPAASAPMSSVKPSFDGNWSVLIVTEKGTCDRAYRYRSRSRRARSAMRAALPSRLPVRSARRAP